MQVRCTEQGGCLHATGMRHESAAACAGTHTHKPGQCRPIEIIAWLLQTWCVGARSFCERAACLGDCGATTCPMCRTAEALYMMGAACKGSEPRL